MDKLPENKIHVENKIVRWFGNYWYYYKWRVIAVVFAAVVLAVCLGQTCANSGTDIKILYAGTYPSSGNAVPGMEDAFRSVMPEDIARDGKPKVDLVMFHVFTDEQIVETEKNNPLIKIDKNNNRLELGKFNDSIAASDTYLCLVDPSLYKMMDDRGLVLPLSEALGYTPENSIDGKAVRLSDTEFGSYFAAFEEMPETYICVRAPGAIQSATGKGKDSHEFEAALAMLKSIVEYTAPEE